MQTTYCTHCGSKNIYSGAKPKFCSSCGKPMSGSTASGEITKKNTKKRPPQKEELIEEDGDTTDIDHVPNVSSLAYEIDTGDGFGYQTYNLKDLVNVRQAEQAAPQENKTKKR